ncbi:hypothetical protein FOZ61_004117 [Perkinsus olseni]|uniref:NADPH--hemoprotein reductase n=1 Tax=Perkinsus olseni TaxID=32597 RepID=A0A7J6LMQ0_PEROL|nr:hypothetical protein FOZ61_004117 [Perkinsus olseni]
MPKIRKSSTSPSSKCSEDGPKEPVTALDVVDTTAYIYFGSQTGTAEAFAIQFGEEATEEQIPNKVCDLADFDPAVFSTHRIVVLILATTGEGDATDNAIKFDKYINHKSTPKDALSGVHYCIFGLGDLNYIQFNGMARRSDAAMQRVGAVKMLERGIGDDCQDIEEDFRKWIDTSGVFEKLKKVAKELHAAPSPGPAQSNGSSTMETTKDSGYISAEHPNVDRRSIDGDDTLSKAIIKCCKTKVVSVERMGSRAVHIDVEIPEGMKYATADTIEVLPANSRGDVDYFVRIFELSGKLDYWIDFEPIDGKCPFPVPSTIREVLLYYLDLRSPPSRQMISALARYDPALKEVVGLQKQMHSSGVHLCLAEFFDLFRVDTSAISFVEFAKICTKQKLRSYTGATPGTSGLAGICCSVLSNALPSKFPSKFMHSCRVTLLDRELGHINPRPQGQDAYTGVASNYLCGTVKAGDEIRLNIRPSAFKLPDPLPLGPIVMVCTGAGIAPFRAMLSELSTSTRCHLVFGCRTRDDILYDTEIAACENICFHLALSREPGVPRRHVQDILRSSDTLRAALCDALNSTETPGLVMVCGQTVMCKELSVYMSSKSPRESPDESSSSASFSSTDSESEDSALADLPRFKIVVIGMPSAGKSCLIHRFVKDRFICDDAEQHAVGVTFMRKTVAIPPGVRIMLKVWAISFEEDLLSMIPHVLHGASGAVIVYDQSNEVEGYTSVHEMLDLIHTNEPSIPVAFAGNKADLCRQTADDGAAVSRVFPSRRSRLRVPFSAFHVLRFLYSSSNIDEPHLGILSYLGPDR